MCFSPPSLNNFFLCFFSPFSFIFPYVCVISRLSHVRLVRLVAYCDEGGEQILVYQFMPNGTLKEAINQGVGACMWEDDLRPANLRFFINPFNSISSTFCIFFLLFFFIFSPPFHPKKFTFETLVCACSRHQRPLQSSLHFSGAP